MKLASTFALTSLSLIALSGCGEKYPKTTVVNGAEVVIVGEAWEPRGTKLSVQSRVCPWNENGQAAYRWSGDGRENICLIFRGDGTIEEAFYEAGSFPIRTEEWKWAAGWPDKRLQPSRVEEDRARSKKPASSEI
ncbi:hypothetical protein MUU75_13500 [Pseudoxanthomonas mexicana]|uniref:hypothetical protein n=1 Tax=Pseudoxanthomonas mexicana TaxID=128785 RepID=UPI001FD6D1A7|nr:hypothetical protein [Pseudoxanthomonas mexicana]UOV04148.1 hypothetical protein MUU75_13500 [Pseudoxanthomonas mexicana]